MNKRNLFRISILVLSISTAQAAYNGLQGFWRSNKPTKLVYSNTYASLATWSCTGMTIRRLDQANRNSVVGSTPITLGGANALFYSDAGCTTAITSASISQGNNSAIVYVSFSATGSQSATISSAGLSSATNTSMVSLNPFTWTGAAGPGDTNWTTAANWAGGVVPGSSDTAHFDSYCGTNCDATINSSMVNAGGISLHSNYIGNISQSSGVNFTASSSTGNFLIEGGNFIGTSGTITNNGGFYLRGGFFTSTGSNFLNYRDFIISGGSFNPNGGRVEFTGSVAQNFTISTGSTNFNLVTFSRSANGFSQTISGTINVSGKLTMNTSLRTKINGGTIAASADVDIIGGNDVYIEHDATIALVGSAPQTLTATSGARIGSLLINSTSTVNLVGSIDLLYNWTYVAGTVSAGTSSVRFLYNTTTTINSGSMDFYDLTLEKTAGITNVTGTVRVLGTLFLKSNLNSPMQGGTIEAYGNVTNSAANGAATGHSTVISLVGTNPQVLTGFTNSNFPALTLNSSGGVTLVGEIVLTNTWTYTSGPVNPGTSTVVFKNNSNTINISGSQDFYNVIYQKSNTQTTLTGTMNVLGTFTQSCVNGCQLNTGTVNLYGDLISNGSNAPGGTATFRFVGTNPQNFSGVATSQSPNIEIASSGGVNLSGTIDIAGNWIRTSGVVNAGTSNVRFLNPITINDSATAFNDVTFIKSGNITAITGTLNVHGNLTWSCSSASCRANGGTIDVRGNVTAAVSAFAPALGPQSTVIRMMGASAQTLTGVAGTSFPTIEIASPGGVTMAGTIDIAGGWTYTSGSVSAGTSHTRFLGIAASTISSGSMSFNDVSFRQSNGALAITGDMNIAGDLILNTSGSGFTNGGNIVTRKNTTVNSSVGGTAALQFLGGLAQAYNHTAGVLPSGSYVVNKTGGQLTLMANMNLPGMSQNFSITSGTVRLNGFALQVGAGPQGAFSVSGAGSTLQCDGGCGAGTACGQGLGKLSCLTLSATGGGVITP